MTQTLRQRQANEIFARREAVKRGKLRTEKSMSEKKARISIYWVYFLIFLVIGGVIVEMFYMIF
ncbi:hypothetical protein PCANB_002720 [Pneumocystis canis]|nr:hypothetical protein PCANB_002720 [Pneumocystis canis]